MSVSTILRELADNGIAATRLCSDSRRVNPGDIFVALPGSCVDGRLFIAEAMVRGAAAVLVDASGIPGVDAGGTAWLKAQTVHALPDVTPPVLVVPDLARMLGELAAEVMGQPSRSLWMAGITGTNGKTSVSQWIAAALGELGAPCGVIGTLGCGLPGDCVASLNTTPDAIAVHSTLADFVRKGVTGCAMEVSSIGLDQHRVGGVHFDVAVFTNLTRDHLDYHGDMAAYGRAKAALFQWPDLGAAVINGDDPFGRELAGGLAACVAGCLYALDPKNVPSGWSGQVLVPSQLAFDNAGLQFELDGVKFAADLVGRFNVSNLLAVIGALQARGYALASIAGALRSLQPPPGRMQVIGGIDEPLVLVDYAHTPDALAQVLATLRETAAERGGRLVCVFGCGGDRDPGKRPHMGRIAAAAADFVLVTSDNPRSEDPMRIIDDIVAGMEQTKHCCEIDRELAIRGAIESAENRDVILVAGKGHEPYQEIQGVRLPFLDESAVLTALAQRRPRRSAA